MTHGFSSAKTKDAVNSENRAKSPGWFEQPSRMSESKLNVFGNVTHAIGCDVGAPKWSHCSSGHSGQHWPTKWPLPYCVPRYGRRGRRMFYVCLAVAFLQLLPGGAKRLLIERIQKKLVLTTTQLRIYMEWRHMRYWVGRKRTQKWGILLVCYMNILWLTARSLLTLDIVNFG